VKCSGRIEEAKIFWRENKKVGMRTENGSLYGMTYCKEEMANLFEKTLNFQK